MLNDEPIDLAQHQRFYLVVESLAWLVINAFTSAHVKAQCRLRAFAFEIQTWSDAVDLTNRRLSPKKMQALLALMRVEVSMHGAQPAMST